MPNELKPCPCCGSEEIRLRHHGGKIVSVECPCGMATQRYENRLTMIKIWNQRTPSAVEALKAVRDKIEKLEITKVHTGALMTSNYISYYSPLRIINNHIDKIEKGE